MAKKKQKKPRGNFKRASKDNPNRTIRTLENREKVLGNIISGKATTVTLAAEMAGLGRNSVYEWMAADQKFKDAVAAAFAGPGKDKLKGVLMDHALHGVQEPVIYEGSIQYVMRPVKKTRIDKKTKEKITFFSAEPVLDKKGDPIPLTVTKWDHNLMQRMLDRMDPPPKGDLGQGLIDLAEELKAARERVGVA